MNIIFMGTPEFAVPSLNILHHSHHKIILVVTVPDKPKGRGQKITISAVKEYSLENKLKIFQPEKLNNQNFVAEVQNLKPDLIVVVAFKILPEEVFSIPKYGSINLHASLLPKYRGAAPINWAIINGEKQTGVTTFFLQSKVDTGNIIFQKPCEILNEDNAGSLHNRLMNIGAEVILSTVELIELTAGNPTIITQNNDEVSFAPKFFKQDCIINWDRLVDNVYNFIRGLSPYPGAFTLIKNKSVKILKTKKTGIQSTRNSGNIEAKGDKILVSCSDEELEIIELQMEGRKKMYSKEFLNGYKYFFE